MRAVTETGITSRRRVAGRLRSTCLASVLVLGFSYGSSATAVAGGTWAGSPQPHAHSAASALADLTGTWENIANTHGSPPWQLVASNGLQALEAHWHGGPGYHENLVGEFHGTLSADGTSYKGPYSITEADPLHPSTGTATFTIQNANRIKLDIGAESIVFTRLGGAPSQTPAPTVVPAPSGWDATTAAVGAVPGGAAVNTSPALGTAKQVTMVAAGLSVEDAVVLAGLKHACYEDFVSALFGIKEKGDYRRAANGRLELYWERHVTSLSTALSNLALCLAIVEALEAAASAASVPHAAPHAARTGCRNVAVTASLNPRGRKPRIKSLHFGAGKLHVSCKTVPGAIAVTYKSSVPLRTLVGPRLQVGVAFGKRDSAGEPVAFSYHKG
jgi:hypothetical protein